jgi:predicted RND superfamily exporter protein
MRWYAASFRYARLPTFLLVVLATIATAWHIPHFAYDEDPRTLFRTRDTAYKELESLFTMFGRDDLDCLIVLKSDDFLTAENIQVVRAIADKAEGIDGVERVFTMLSVRRPFRIRSYYLPLIPPYQNPSAADLALARQTAQDNPLLTAGLLSQDRKVTVLAIRVDQQHSDITDIAQVVDQLRGICREATQRGGIEASLSGLPVVRLDHLRAMQHDQLVFNVLGTGLATLVAGLLLRNAVAVLIVMGGPGIGVIWTVGVLSAVGTQINLLNIVIPPILIVIGLANAIHLLAEFKRQLHAGYDRREATVRAMERVGMACALAALTTAIGFASLALAEADMIRSFGLAAAGGCGLVFLAVVTVVPLLTSSFLGEWVRSGRSLHHRDATSRFASCLRPVESHCWIFAITGVVATLLLSCSVFGLTADNRLTEANPREERGTRALLLLDRTFGGSLPASIMVRWPDQKGRAAQSTFLNVLRKTHAAVENGRWSAPPVSLLTLLETITPSGQDVADSFGRLRHIPPEHVLSLMHPEHRCAVVRVLVPDSGAARLEPRFQQVRLRLKEIEREHPGYHIQLTGTPVVAFRNTRLIIEALYRSLALAALLVFLIVSLWCRSLTLGLLSVIPNAFPLAMTSMVLWLTSGRLEIASVVVFSVCLGIATDDTIHFLSRFQRERVRLGDPGAAISRTFVHMTEVMTVTTVVIASGFAVVLFSDQPALQLFSKLALVALASALIGDLLILPALLFCWERIRNRRLPAPTGADGT